MTTRIPSQPSSTATLSTINIGTRRVAISLCLFLVFFPSFSISAQDRVIGHVLDLEGDWYLDGRPGQPLSQGQALPAGGLIRIPSPSRYSSIVIIYSANNQAVRRQCRNPGECQQPIMLPRAVQREPTFLDSLYEGAMKWLRGDVPIPKPHAGKSSDGRLREAVVQIVGSRVDLTPVFIEMKKGMYQVQLERKMPDPKKAEFETMNPPQVNWESDVARLIFTSELKPGLYEIVLLEKRGTGYSPTLTTAWFLVTSTDEYTRLSDQFREASNSIANWKDQVPEETARVFLRALLIHLATEPTPKQPAKNEP